MIQLTENVGNKLLKRGPKPTSKRDRATFSIDADLLEDLRKTSRLKDIEQSDIVEWGIRQWLQKFAGETQVQRGRPVYVETDYEIIATLAQIMREPHGPIEEAFAKYVKTVVQSTMRDGDG